MFILFPVSVCSADPRFLFFSLSIVSVHLSLQTPTSWSIYPSILFYCLNAPICSAHITEAAQFADESLVVEIAVSACTKCVIKSCSYFISFSCQVGFVLIWSICGRLLTEHFERVLRPAVYNTVTQSQLGFSGGEVRASVRWSGTKNE